MIVTPANIKKYFPEFKDLDDEFIQLYIEEALIQIDERRWGVYYRLGVLYLTAHLIAMANRTSSGISPGGIVSSESVGDTSVSYAVPGGITTDNYYFSQTPYGIRYLELARIPGSGPLVA